MIKPTEMRYLLKQGALIGWLVGQLVLCAALHAEPDVQHVYVTWEGSEPDRGASAWFIKRFVDPQAVFKVIPQNAPLPEGTAFDVPESRYQRSGRYSTFELLVNEHPTDDPAVKRMGLIIHDIEINTWQRKVATETPAVLMAMEKIRGGYGTKPVPLDCQIAFFDEVYASLKRTPDGRGLGLDIPAACK